MIADSNFLDMSLADVGLTPHRVCRPLAKSFDKKNRISKLLGGPSGTTVQYAPFRCFFFPFFPFFFNTLLCTRTVSDALCKHVQRHKMGSSGSAPTKIVLLGAYLFFTPAVYAVTGASVLRRDLVLAPSPGD
ncbi:hypothetical protein J3458_009137 [Metarhizium acridum]|uniref:uncharacterized protein n=1 Tax=Metarhizium acridum TaxID=92637 RepID=UPI001C6D0BF5|nr:hypothetical protein J3458_009137 [Metarhizium acridum]